MRKAVENIGQIALIKHDTNQQGINTGAQCCTWKHCNSSLTLQLRERQIVQPTLEPIPSTCACVPTIPFSSSISLSSSAPECNVCISCTLRCVTRRDEATSAADVTAQSPTWLNGILALHSTVLMFLSPTTGCVPPRMHTWAYNSHPIPPFSLSRVSPPRTYR